MIDYSHFRLLFQLTTEKMQARCRFDSFSGSVMQLHKDELLLFIDELHTSLEDYYLETGSICIVCERTNSRGNVVEGVNIDLRSEIDHFTGIVMNLFFLRSKDWIVVV